MRPSAALLVYRRSVTLIEMMIVMFLIALITGVVAYNYRGSLEEGKAFKTEAGIEKLQTILSLSIAEDPRRLTRLTNDPSAWKEVVKNSPLVHNADALLRDGWGNDYLVTIRSNGSIFIESERYNEYKQQKGLN